MKIDYTSSVCFQVYIIFLEVNPSVTGKDSSSDYIPYYTRSYTVGIAIQLICHLFWGLAMFPVCTPFHSLMYLMDQNNASKIRCS
jgi:hypothetical protein